MNNKLLTKTLIVAMVATQALQWLSSASYLSWFGSDNTESLSLLGRIRNSLVYEVKELAYSYDLDQNNEIYRAALDDSGPNGETFDEMVATLKKKGNDLEWEIKPWGELSHVEYSFVDWSETKSWWSPVWEYRITRYWIAWLVRISIKNNNSNYDWWKLVEWWYGWVALSLLLDEEHSIKLDVINNSGSIVWESYEFMIDPQYTTPSISEKITQSRWTTANQRTQASDDVDVEDDTYVKPTVFNSFLFKRSSTVTTDKDTQDEEDKKAAKETARLPRRSFPTVPTRTARPNDVDVYDDTYVRGDDYTNFLRLRPMKKNDNIVSSVAPKSKLINNELTTNNTQDMHNQINKSDNDTGSFAITLWEYILSGLDIKWSTLQYDIDTETEKYIGITMWSTLYSGGSIIEITERDSTSERKSNTWGTFKNPVDLLKLSATTYWWTIFTNNAGQRLVVKYSDSYDIYTFEWLTQVWSDGWISFHLTLLGTDSSDQYIKEVLNLVKNLKLAWTDMIPIDLNMN